MSDVVHKGSCLCGAVTIAVTGELSNPMACHCGNCRKQTGHYEVSVDVPKARVKVLGEVAWYQSSEKVRRGFCGTCGSTLLWDPVFRDWIGVAMGVFDTPTGVAVAKHIFVSDKGDYYTLDDGLPQE